MDQRQVFQRWKSWKPNLATSLNVRIGKHSLFQLVLSKTCSFLAIFSFLTSFNFKALSMFTRNFHAIFFIFRLVFSTKYYFLTVFFFSGHLESIGWFLVSLRMLQSAKMGPQRSIYTKIFTFLSFFFVSAKSIFHVKQTIPIQKTNC